MTIEATVCLVRRDGKLLLQKKASERFGGGKWDGPGGKLRPGESPADGVVREVEEETGLRIIDPAFRGSFEVYFGAGDQPDWVVHVFSGSRFGGELRPSDEGELRWFPEDQLPYEEMWPSDPHWLPDVLAGRRFQATLWFDEKAETLLDHMVNLDPE
ncbi:MAG: 8-oxo-dGTP diphosphatase [Chloroflexi bacterium]|nr:8-oxo-dGTP diphosphatase [Chloroflexota bacterium]